VIRNLTLLGVVFVILAGGFAAFSQPETSGSPAAEFQVDKAEEPAASPTTTVNREDCDAIRGTQYFSPEERVWFLANCVGP
jgi:hypothetical protein